MLVFLCMNFHCSYFNNPVEPTHTYGVYFQWNEYEVLIRPSKVEFQCAYGFTDIVEKDTPAVVLYLKTDTDFTKKFAELNDQNSTFIYRVFRDSVVMFEVYYSIVFLSVKDGTTDTTYYNTIENLCIEIPLNNELMGHPERFLWQTKIKDLKHYVLPPRPYAYVAGNAIITK